MVARNFDAIASLVGRVFFAGTFASILLGTSVSAWSQTVPLAEDSGTQTSADVENAADTLPNSESSDASSDAVEGLPLISGVSDRFDAFRRAMDDLEADVSSKITQITDLETALSGALADVSNLTNVAEEQEALIDALETEIANGVESVAALTSLLDEKETFIEKLQTTLGEGEGALESISSQYELALAEISRLTEEVSVGVAALADLEVMREERDGLAEKLQGLEQTIDAGKSELAAALTTITQLQSAQSEASALADELAAVKAEQAAEKHQRFWLAILVALLIVAIGFLLLRGRKES